MVDQTEKGWFIQYIDRNPYTIQRQEALHKKEKMDMDDEERSSKFIQKQIERAAVESKDKEPTPVEFTELQRDGDEEKITLNLGLKKKAELPSTSAAKDPSVGNPLRSVKGNTTEPQSRTSSKGAVAGQKRKSVLDDIMKVWVLSEIHNTNIVDF